MILFLRYNGRKDPFIIWPIFVYIFTCLFFPSNLIPLRLFTLIDRQRNYSFTTILSLQGAENCTATANNSLDVNSTSANDNTLFPEKIFCNFYTEWTTWSRCNEKCMQTRMRKCRKKDVCGKSRFKERQICSHSTYQCPDHTFTIINSNSRNRAIEDRLYDIFFHPWSKWSPCSDDCKTRRRRRCKTDICAGGYLEEEKSCKTTSDCKKMSLQVKKRSPNKKQGYWISQKILYFLLICVRIWTAWIIFSSYFLYFHGLNFQFLEYF